MLTVALKPRYKILVYFSLYVPDGVYAHHVQCHVQRLERHYPLAAACLNECSEIFLLSIHSLLIHSLSLSLHTYIR